MQKLSESGSCAAWAPDSKRLAYGHDGDGGIWITDLDGKNKMQLVSEGKDPSWSPDGRMIAYVLQKEDEDIWLVQADGSGEPEHLVKGMYPHWTADGKELIYFSPEAQALYAINCTNKETRRIFSVEYEYSVLSPDGKRVAYVPYGGLWVASVDNPEEKVCLSPMKTMLLLAWSTDGRYIVYGGFLYNVLGMWVVPTDSSQSARRIHPLATKPAWSPDGKLIAYDDGIRANSGIALMDAAEAMAQASTLEEVIDQMKKKVQSAGARSIDHYRLGEFLAWTGRYKEANEAFNKSSELGRWGAIFKQQVVERAEKQEDTGPAEEKKVITVKVINEQQQPVEGASIKLTGLRPINSLGSEHGIRGEDPGRFVTDSSGTAEVKYPGYVYERVETGAICFDVSHSDYADTHVTSYKIDGGEGPIVMSVGAELLAIALLDGETVSEFAVRGTHSEFKSQVKEGTDGRSVEKIKEGNYPIYFSYTDPDGGRYYSDVKILEAKTGMSHQIEMTLYPAISLKGVLDPSVPRPIKNGEVKVDMINEKRMEETERGRRHKENPATVNRWFEAEINEDGSFLLPELPKGYGEIIAICDGFVSTIDRDKPTYLQNQHFDLQLDGQEIVVKMEPAATFSGKVVDAEGRAVAGVEVVLWPNVFWGSASSQVFMNWNYSATTDDKGEFSVVNLPVQHEESYTVRGADYELAVQPVENQPLRRQQRVKLSPGEETYQEIQVAPRGQTQIEAFRTE
jgi:hypothetical protein